ncbi:MAG: SAM-dependent methyltransferase [Roseburia sp.]|nr:SAM-dependent methyltransferase [Roseburia sp.]
MDRFVFDFVLDHPTETTVRLLTQETECITPTTLERHTDNLCPYAVPSVKEIVKLIDRACVMHDKDRFISDLLCCMAISISNLVDKMQYDKREEEYKQTISHYNKQEQQALSEICGKIFMLLSSVVYDDGVFADYLGELFMGCNMGNSHNGQFFTPYHVSKLCAKLSIGTPKKGSGEILTVNDPCCGSGGMMIAALDVLKNDFDINYTMDCFVDCSDIDIRCVHMAYLQLSLAGVPAIVKHQDSLTQTLYSVWRTPAFMFQYSRFRKYERLN